ncbi:MAG: right-handed parallel beta-helix repeat-containing protein [Planctomycetota bacterium]
MRALGVLLLATAVSADPLPEGGSLVLTSPEAGTLLLADRGEVDVRWKAEGLPESAYVRVQYRVGTSRWYTATGGSYVPIVRGRFLVRIGRIREKGAIAIGLRYLTPHAPKTWTVSSRGGLKAIETRVRPGDTVVCTVDAIDAGVGLPAGVTLRGAPGTGTSVIFGKRNGVGITLYGVPGFATPTRVDGFRFRVGPQAPPRMAGFPHGIQVRGGTAELVDCVFDPGLGTGVQGDFGARIVARGCRFEIPGGSGIHIKGRGTSVDVRGGVFTRSGYGVQGQGDTVVAVRDATFEGLSYAAVRINGRRARSVHLETCRVRKQRTGFSLQVLDRAVVRDCTIEVSDVAIHVNGELPIREGRAVRLQTRAEVIIEKNHIRGATIGVRAQDVLDCIVRGNIFDRIDAVGVQFDCPGTIENNRMRGTRRPSDYAPPEFHPAWQLGTIGVLYGLERRDAKPIIRGNVLHGCSRAAIVFVGGAQATVADNEFDGNLAKPSQRISVASNKQRETLRKRWNQTRARWEQKHPEERKRRR